VTAEEKVLGKAVIDGRGLTTPHAPYSGPRVLKGILGGAYGPLPPPNLRRESSQDESPRRATPGEHLFYQYKSLYEAYKADFKYPSNTGNIIGVPGKIFRKPMGKLNHRKAVISTASRLYLLYRLHYTPVQCSKTQSYRALQWDPIRHWISRLHRIRWWHRAARALYNRLESLLRRATV